MTDKTVAGACWKDATNPVLVGIQEELGVRFRTTWAMTGHVWSDVLLRHVPSIEYCTYMMDMYGMPYKILMKCGVAFVAFGGLGLANASPTAEEAEAKTVSALMPGVIVVSGDAPDFDSKVVIPSFSSVEELRLKVRLRGDVEGMPVDA